MVTSNVSGLIVTTLLAALLSAQLRADQPRTTSDTGWTRRASRWWLGDGRRPPVPVDATDEREPVPRHVDAPAAGADLFEWWFGDGSRPPRRSGLR